jgi:hypothetical protein
MACVTDRSARSIGLRDRKTDVARRLERPHWGARRRGESVNRCLEPAFLPTRRIASMRGG